ncbi:Protein phosphatase PP2A regulatory subunit B [Borealophlyctis nickersoniae]|nr:Protein phosphatase PP2A regulatory subunit B [Borealophlyctis nickersoniae]
MLASADALDSYPTLYVSGLPPTITELDLVKVLNEMKMETKVIVERDPVTAAPLGRIKLVFRYLPDAERFYATVNGSMFLGAKVHLTFKDPNMNFSNTSGSKAIVVKHIPLGVTSLEFYESVRGYGRIISCKVMIDRSGTESYALLQFENQDCADKCLAEMNGSVFKGNTIALTWQFPKNSPYQYPTAKSATTPTVRTAGSPNGSNRASWQQPTSPNGQLAAAAGWTPPGSIPGDRSSWGPTSNVTAPIGGWTSGPPGQQNWTSPASSPSQSPPPAQWNPPSASPTPSWTGSNPTGGSPVPATATGWHSSNTTAPPPTASDAGLDDKNLYVKNLEEHIDNLELFNMFRKYGRIISARVMRDETNGRSKGFGFVSYESSDQAGRALREMNGKRYGTKNLVVNIAEPKGYRQSKLAAFHAHKTSVGGV